MFMKNQPVKASTQEYVPVQWSRKQLCPQCGSVTVCGKRWVLPSAIGAEMVRSQEDFSTEWSYSFPVMCTELAILTR